MEISRNKMLSQKVASFKIVGADKGNVLQLRVIRVYKKNIGTGELKCFVQINIRIGESIPNTFYK